MRRPSRALLFPLGVLTLVAVGARGGGRRAPGDAAHRYLTDRAFRRAELAASLVEPNNGYSRLRLLRYAVGDGRGWEALPEWNPPCEPVTADHLRGAPETPIDAGPVGPAAAPIAIPSDVVAGPSALRALGEAAFFRYPVQLLPGAGRALRSAEAAEALGARALVRVALPHGRVAVALTCASCHVAERDGAPVVGLGNERLDLGRLLARASGRGDGAGAAPTWGPGRLDVSTASGDEPVRIPDIRPTRWLTHLSADATVEQRDLVTLAIRTETLLITAHGGTLRPPRAIALGLAAYVWSLSDRLGPRPPAPTSAAERRGAARFAERCAGCHAPPGLTGPPVPIELVGTDPAVGRSQERGTGDYRVPSLRGVRDRRGLLHDGSLPDLAALFDPARTRPDFAGGTRAGPVAGHRFGLDLDAAARADLLAYLGTL